MNLLLDEMWPSSIALQLRHRGHDVVAVAERPELRSQPDSAIFSVALAEDRAIVTENVGDFRRLAADAIQQGQSYPGLVLTTNRRFLRHDPRTAGRLVTALDHLLSAGLDVASREHWLSSSAGLLPAAT